MTEPSPEYPYPPDAFDREADTTSFHGAHRAEEAFWRQNLLYIVVIAAAILTLLVLLFVVAGMGRDGGGSDAGASTAAPSSEAPPASASAAPAEPQGDRSTPVLVMNAGGQKGMAATWKSALEDKGWTNVDVQTAQSRQEQPVVFYRDEADAASANLLAQDAGLEGAQQSDEYDARITILVVNAPEG